MNATSRVPLLVLILLVALPTTLLAQIRKPRVPFQFGKNFPFGNKNPFGKNFPFGNGKNPFGKNKAFADFEKQFNSMFGQPSKQDSRQAAAEERRLARVRVSVSEEKKIGLNAARAFIGLLRKKGIKTTTEGKDLDYIDKLVTEIRPLMKNHRRYRKIKVYLVKSQKTDARSFPGGTIFVYQGMLDYMDSEAELVGVIGHELSHMDRQHQLRSAKRAKMNRRRFSRGFSFDKFFSQGPFWLNQFVQPFRPQDEVEADSDGARWAFKAGYDPRELAKLFRKWQQRDGGGLRFGTFMRSHPYHADRFQAVMKIHEKLTRGRPDLKLYKGKKNLQQRIPRSKKIFPE